MRGGVGLQFAGEWGVILIVTHKHGFEADFVIDVLRARGAPVARFNQEDYPTKARSAGVWRGDTFDGILSLGRSKVRVADVEVAWLQQFRPPQPEEHLGEGARRIARAEAEAFLSGFWESVPWDWVNHPTRVAWGSNKVYQLRFAEHLGFTIPRTLITTDTTAALAFVEQSEGGAIIKDLATQALAIGQDTYISYTRRITREEISAHGIAGGIPVCLQENVPKRVEIRATVVGEKIFPVAVDSQYEEATRDDYRRGDLEAGDRYTIAHLPPSVEHRCIRLVKELGLEYGAIDLIRTPGDDYVFLEVNTTGAWVWAEKLTGLPITEALADLLVERLNRVTGSSYPQSEGSQ